MFHILQGKRLTKLRTKAFNSLVIDIDMQSTVCSLGACHTSFCVAEDNWIIPTTTPFLKAWGLSFRGARRHWGNHDWWSWRAEVPVLGNGNHIWDSLLVMVAFLQWSNIFSNPNQTDFALADYKELSTGHLVETRDAFRSSKKSHVFTFMQLWVLKKRKTMFINKKSGTTQNVCHGYAENWHSNTRHMSQ